MENWRVETWKIVVRGSGADSYKVTGDRPRMPDPAISWMKFAPEPTYEASKKRIEEGDQEAAKQVGSYLFYFLFNGPMGRAFREWCAFALEKESILRLLLDLDEVLIDEPWEYIFSRDLEFLSLNQDFSLVRYVEMGGNQSKLITNVNDTALLILVSNPLPGSVNDHLETGPEVQAICSSFPGARVIQDEQSSLYGLQRSLSDYNSGYHILHLIGHSGEGQFLFRSRNAVNREVVGSGSEIALVLKEYRTLRLLIFTSCASSELILPLVRLQGVPAVVAMQYDIEDGSAEEFSRTLYRSLASGMPLDLAIYQARRALFIAFDTRKTLWGSPTLTVTSVNALSCFFPGNHKQYSDKPDKESTVNPTVTPSAANQVELDGRENTAKLTEGGIVKESNGGFLITEAGRIIRAHQTLVSALAFVEAKHVLISGAQDASLKAWQCNPTEFISDEPASQIRGSWTGHKGEIVALLSIQSTDGSAVVLSAGRDSDLRAWNWINGTLIGKYRMAATTVSAIATDTKNFVLAFATLSGKLFYLKEPLKLFYLPEPQNIFTLAHEREIMGIGTHISFSDNGNWLAVASARTHLQLWGLDKLLARDPVRVEHDEIVQCVTAISNERFIVGTVSGKLWLWHMGDKPERLQVITDQIDTEIKWLIWLKSHGLLLVASSNLVSLWGVNNTIFLPAKWSWKPEASEITSLAVSDDGILIAVGLSSGSINLFRVSPQSPTP